MRLRLGKNYEIFEKRKQNGLQKASMKKTVVKKLCIYLEKEPKLKKIHFVHIVIVNVKCME